MGDQCVPRGQQLTKNTVYVQLVYANAWVSAGNGVKWVDRFWNRPPASILVSTQPSPDTIFVPSQTNPVSRTVSVVHLTSSNVVGLRV